MSNIHQLNEYKKTAVNSANPLQLVIMLYDGAIRFMGQAKQMMIAGDMYNKNENLQKAQRILTELTSCLDMEKGGEVAKSLFGLYSYCYNRLVEANVEDNPEYIDQATRVLSELRESWVLLKQNQRPDSAEGVSVEQLAA